MLICNLLETVNSVKEMSLEECSYALSMNSMIFENGILEANNKLMEAQICAFNTLISEGGNLTENVSNLNILQESVIGNFIEKAKSIIMTICRKIKEIWNSIFKADRKSTSGNTSTSSSPSVVASSPSSVAKRVAAEEAKADVENKKQIDALEVNMSVVDIEACLNEIHIEHVEGIVDNILEDLASLVTEKIKKMDSPNDIGDIINDAGQSAKIVFMRKVGLGNNDETETAIKEIISSKTTNITINKNTLPTIDILLKKESQRIDKLQKTIQDVLGSAMCEELTKLPNNKDMFKAIRANLPNNDNMEYLEQKIVITQGNVILKLSTIINNITNAFIKVFLQNKKAIKDACTEYTVRLFKITSEQACDELSRKIGNMPEYRA